MMFLRTPLAALLVTCLTATAFAQEAVLPAPYPSASEEAESPETLRVAELPATPGSDGVELSAVEAPRPTGYWRVGTRRCGQTFDSGICSCAMTVCYCDDCGQCRPASEAELLASLTPGVPVCCFIHGSLVTEQDSREDSLSAYRWLRRHNPDLSAHFIFFDWPSDRRLSLMPAMDYLILETRAARNAFPLAKLVSQVPAETPICLIGHSHGARTALAAAHLMHGGSVQGFRLGFTDTHHRLRIVLAAAAVDHDWLNPGERYDRAICRAECIVNLQNRCDYALLLYPLRKPFGVAALGQRGLTRRDTRMLGGLANRLTEVDVSDLLGKEHLWPYYYRQPAIARTITQSVYFTDSPQVAHR